jgi:hypothetical protein
MQAMEKEFIILVQFLRNHFRINWATQVPEPPRQPLYAYYKYAYINPHNGWEWRVGKMIASNLNADRQLNEFTCPLRHVRTLAKDATYWSRN